jgi:hypothetical protein
LILSRLDLEVSLRLGEKFNEHAASGPGRVAVEQRLLQSSTEEFDSLNGRW